MKDDRLYLTNILESIQRIESYTHAGKDAFVGSTQIQDAVIRNFEVSGEAVKPISDELKNANADIPWRRIAGFRDVLIHDYRRIVLDEVWQAVERDFPLLKSRIEQILENLA
jgi:uncharacterized protein with HEPN domain